MTLPLFPINIYEIIIVAFKIPTKEPSIKDSDRCRNMEPLRFPPTSQLTRRTSRVIHLQTTARSNSIRNTGMRTHSLPILLL